MGYQLETGEGLSGDIRRIVLEQIDKALINLNSTVKDKDEAIHDARVCIKRIRAVLRLTRYSLGKHVYVEENKAYRDSARLLSKVRDGAAMIEIVDKLTEHFSDHLSKDAFDSLRAQLLRSKRKGESDRLSAMTDAAKALHQARKRVHEWPDAGPPSVMIKGLRRVFKRGRAAFTAAYPQPTVESLHEWRKQVKHLQYQTQILQPLWPGLMKAMRGELKTLGKLLSEDHDLAILRENVIEQESDSEDRTETEALVALVDQRRNELQVGAKVLGAKIYAEKPKAFVVRVEGYWDAWRSESKTGLIAVS
jgi:CHAD domain-containing protein